MAYIDDARLANIAAFPERALRWEIRQLAQRAIDARDAARIPPHRQPGFEDPAPMSLRPTPLASLGPGGDYKHFVTE